MSFSVCERWVEWILIFKNEKLFQNYLMVLKDSYFGVWVSESRQMVVEDKKKPTNHLVWKREK